MEGRGGHNFTMPIGEEYIHIKIKNRKYLQYIEDLKIEGVKGK